MPITSTELAAEIDVVVPAPTAKTGSDFTAPSVVTLTTAIETKSVYVAALPSVSVTPMAPVDFTTVSTSDAVTNESLNRNATTLRDDINSKLSAFSSDLTTKIAELAANASTADSALASDVNLQLAKLKTESTTMLADVNTAIETLRQADLAQNTSIANNMNSLATELASNDTALKTAIDAVHDKVQALDSLFGTDADIATTIATVNGFITTLRETDLDFVQAVDATIDELNSLERLRTKEVVITNANGKYLFNTLTEGFPQFLTANDYEVKAEVINNEAVQVAVINKTSDGFELFARSNGVHYVPQVVDGSVTPVRVTVSLAHDKLNPMTMNVDTLTASWLAGNGTDVNVVGAEPTPAPTEAP